MLDIVIPHKGDKICCATNLNVRQLRVWKNKKQTRSFTLYKGQCLTVASSLYTYDKQNGVYVCEVDFLDRQETFGSERDPRLKNILIPITDVCLYFKLLSPGERLPEDFELVVAQKRELLENDRWEDLA